MYFFTKSKVEKRKKVEVKAWVGARALIKTKIWAGIEIKKEETIDIEIRVSLFLI